MPEFFQRPVFRWSLRLILGLVILALLLRGRETLGAVVDAWRGISPLVILGAIAFYWLGQILCAWKWQLLLKARGHAVSLSTCARIYAAGMFGNLWLPTNIGGDALRASLLQKSAPKLGLADAAASILVERLTGFFALLVLAICGVLFQGARGNALQTVVFGALIFVVSVAVGFAVSRLKIKKVASIRASLGFYLEARNRRVLAVSLMLSFAFQISQVLLNIGLARAIGLDLETGIFWWLGPVLSLSGLIPAGIGGLGVREAAAVGLIGNLAPHAQILAWSLLWQATVWGASLPGVLFLKPHAKSAAK